MDVAQNQKQENKRHKQKKHKNNQRCVVDNAMW